MSLPTSSKKDLPRNFLPLSFVPHDTDVLIGRGRRVVNHPGNKTFRALVQGNLAAYSLAETKSKKSNIIVGIFQALKTASRETSGFVKFHSATKRWYVVDDANARISIAQAFRDSLSFEYKSSKQYKQQKRQEERGELPVSTIPLSGLMMTSTLNNAQENSAGMSLNTSSLFADQFGQAPAPPPPSLIPQVSIEQSSLMQQQQRFFPTNAAHLNRLTDILETASHVVQDEGDDFFGAQSDTMLQKPQEADFFSSLYSAFGATAKVDPCVDPFEPTPMAFASDEQPSEIESSDPTASWGTVISELPPFVDPQNAMSV